MTRLTAAVAAGLIAAAGLAAPAAAQSTMTSITNTNGKVSGYSTRKIDGVEYKITFDDSGVTAAYADGLMVNFHVKGQKVIVDPEGDAIEFDMIRREAGGRLLTAPPAPPAPPGAFGGPNAQGFFFNTQPKTMVGLTQRPLDVQLREHLELEDGVGTMILSIVEGLPADKAGMKAGDVLIHVNGRKVTGSDVLTDVLTDVEPGDDVEVTVLRKGLPESLTITVEKFNPEKLFGERFNAQFFEPRGGQNLNWQLFAPGEGGNLNWDFGGDFDLDIDLGDIEGLDDEEIALLEGKLSDVEKSVRDALLSRDGALRQLDLLRGGAMGELLLRQNMDGRERAIIVEKELGELKDRRADLTDRTVKLLEELKAATTEDERNKVIEKMTKLREHGVVSDIEARVVEGQAREGRRSELEKEAIDLRRRNQELESRLDQMEERMDRLIELLEKQSDG